MKINKHKLALIGLAASTLFAATGCRPHDNEPATVYGPPEYFGVEEDQEQPEPDQENNGSEENGEIDPGENYGVDVYGPPEFFEQDGN